MTLEHWFPTSIGVELLDPPSKVQDRMIDYVDKFYNKNKDYPGHCLTGDVVEDSKLHHNPIFSWLNSQVYNQVKKYLEDLGADISTLNIYATKAWPVVIKNGGGINYHKHQNSSLNAIYYLTTGGEGGQIQFQATHSELNFLPFNFKEPNINQFSFTKCDYPPIPNRMLIFPSTLQHAVVPYIGDSPRYSISYDIMITMKRNSHMEYSIPDPSEWKNLT